MYVVPPLNGFSSPPAKLVFFIASICSLVKMLAEPFPTPYFPELMLKSRSIYPPYSTLETSLEMHSLQLCQLLLCQLVILPILEFVSVDVLVMSQVVSLGVS